MSGFPLRVVHRRNGLTGEERFGVEVFFGEHWAGGSGTIFGLPAGFDSLAEAFAGATAIAAVTAWETVAVYEGPPFFVEVPE